MAEFKLHAEEFCNKYKVCIKKEFLFNGYHFKDEETKRDVYRVTISRPDRKEYSFNFGQSLDKSDLISKNKLVLDQIRVGQFYIDIKNPLALRVCKKYGLNPRYANLSSERLKELMLITDYDILACVTKYDPGSYVNFCGEYGYDTDSRQGLETYLAVSEEYHNIHSMFYDCMDELREIN